MNWDDYPNFSEAEFLRMAAEGELKQVIAQLFDSVGRHLHQLLTRKNHEPHSSNSRIVAGTPLVYKQLGI